MQKMFRFLVTGSLLFVAIAVHAQESDSLTVESAVARAIATSAAMRQAESLRQAAEARVTQSESDYYPNVAGTAMYARIGPVPAIDFPGLGEFRLAPADNYDAHVGVRQTVYDFGRRSAGVDVSRSNVRSAADNLRAIKSGLTVQTIQAFSSCLYLEQGLQVQDQQISALQEHMAVTQRRVRSGSATEFDELTTSVRVADAQGRRVELQRMLRDQQVVLRRLTGLPWDAPVKLSGTFDRRPVDRSIDSLVAQGRRERPDIVAADDAVESARLQQHLAALENVPVLRVNASYGIKNGYEPNLNAARGNWTAGVLLEVPIFTGFHNQGREEEANASFRAAEQRRDDLLRSAEAEIRQAYEGVASAQERVQISALQVTQAEEAVRNARNRYDSGVATNLDVLDAETSVATAKLQQVQAFYQYAVARVSLDAATGTFSR